MNIFQRFLLAGLQRTLPSLTPRRRQLPLRYRFSEWDGTCENELRFLDRIVVQRKTAVDVGANVGIYSLRMAQLFQRVVAFEPNGRLTVDLAAWNPGNVEIVHQALSSARGEAVLRLPWVGGRAQNGWGSLEPDNPAGAERFTEMRIKTAPLDEWELNEVSFIKIDVEGHELPALRGAAQTIARNRPVVLIEVRDTNEAAVLEYFRGLNYGARTLESFVPAAGSPQNRIFVPR